MKKLIYYISDEFLNKIIDRIAAKYYLWGLIIVGIVIRGRQYLANRSFWLDEAFLANNLKDRDYSQLLEPLDYSQVAPIGFLFIEKFMANTFGLTELSLRFIPFVSSILAIYCLFEICRILLDKTHAVIITVAFLLPISMTYFSSELKQYMTDLALALLLFWFYFKYIHFTWNSKKTLYLGIIGAVLIWLSNITPIILFAIGLAMWIHLLRHYIPKKLSYLIISQGMWLLSFGIYYFNFIKDHPHSAGMKAYWATAFMPSGVTAAFSWLASSFDSIFRNTLSYYEMTWLALALFVAGLISAIYKRQQRNLLLLLLPVLLHIVLSGFKLYPFSDRLVLYLVPFLLIFVVVGISFIAGFFRYKTAVMLMLAVVLLAFSLLRTKHYFLYPMMKEDIKPVLAYVAEHRQKSDIIYVYSGSRAVLQFYKEHYFDGDDHLIIGISSGENYDKFVKEFSSLNGRIWVIFSHMNPPDGIRYLEEVLPAYEQLDTFEAPGAKVYLIDKP